MKKALHIPGFPAPQKHDTIRFYVFKGLSYSARMILYLSFIVMGFILQIIMLKVWPGATFLLFAAFLNLVHGYKSVVNLKAFNPDSNWTQVDISKLSEIEAFNNRLSKWDKDILDISNAAGFFMFLLSALVLGLVSAFLRSFSVGNEVLAIFVSDAIILVFPLWFNGLRRIHKQDVLCTKTKLVLNLESFFRTIKEDGEAFNPTLMLARDEKGESIPTDCRFTITFNGMPTDFYGIQAQVNINSVEGANYPYFYCVISAKTGFGLIKYANLARESKDIIVSYEEDSSAEVIVIRQFTTKTTGYHTKINSCRKILETALTIFRRILH